MTLARPSCNRQDKMRVVVGTGNRESHQVDFDKMPEPGQIFAHAGRVYVCSGVNGNESISARELVELDPLVAIRWACMELCTLKQRVLQLEATR